jgi:hypothetical protein
MASIRQLANCIGVSGTFWVLRDFFGYATGAPDTLSLRQQVQLLQGNHLHVNVIRVGIESFTDADEEEIDFAVHSTRSYYAAVNLGIGRVERYRITTADANGRDYIDNDGEAEALTDEWTVSNDAADVFIVRGYAGTTIGLSRVDGPCDKDAKGMDGSVVAIESTPTISGLVFAHELAHYLGLGHVNDSNNLMNPTVPNGGQLTSSQGSTMRSHCFVKSGC